MARAHRRRLHVCECRGRYAGAGRLSEDSKRRRRTANGRRLRQAVRLRIVCAAEVLAGNGVAVDLFASDVPTPLVSFEVKRRGLDGGVVITASHNPPDFNGFKFKAPYGGSATPAITDRIETLLGATSPRRLP